MHIPVVAYLDVQFSRNG